jgi:hypothetical protein
MILDLYWHSSWSKLLPYLLAIGWRLRSEQCNCGWAVFVPFGILICKWCLFSLTIRKLWFIAKPKEDGNVLHHFCRCDAPFRPWVEMDMALIMLFELFFVMTCRRCEIRFCFRLCQDMVASLDQLYVAKGPEKRFRSPGRLVAVKKFCWHHCNKSRNILYPICFMYRIFDHS